MKHFYLAILASALFFTTTPAQVLPVNLRSFKGFVSDCKATLEWESGIDMSRKYFELQWSSDGNTYIAVANVVPINSGLAEHTYTQIVTVRTPVNYYRLKLVTIDGIVEYSKILTLNSSDCYVASPEVRIFPNPVVGHIVSMTLSGFEEGLAGIEMADMAGKQIKSYKRLVYAGQNQLLLELPSTLCDMYIIKITGQNMAAITEKIFLK